MKKSFKLCLLAGVLASVILVSTGCSSYPSKSKMKKIASEACPSEKFTQTDYSTKDGRKMTFESKERDLEFHVTATKKSFWKWNFVSESPSELGSVDSGCDYAQVVKELYMDDVKDYIEKNIPSAYLAMDKGASVQYDFYVYSEEDIDELVPQLVAADDIYKQELEYNDEDWLEEHYLMNIAVCCKNKETDKREWVFTKINGQLSEKSLTKDLLSGLETASAKS